MPVDLDEYLKKELATDLASDRPRVRRDAVTVLGRLGVGTRTLEILKGVADSDPDEGLRGHARAHYSELWSRSQETEGARRRVADESDPGRLDLALFEQALDDPSAVRRLRALLEGIELFDPRMVPLVIARIDAEPDDWVLATMVKAIAVGGDLAHVPRLARYLEDERRARLVANTIEAIACLDPQAARGMLRPFVNHADGRVQSTAVLALYRVDAAAAIDVLRGMAAAGQPRTRDAAVHCLIQIDDPDAVEVLLAMPAGENNYGLVEKVVAWFAKAGDAVAGAKALAMSEAQAGVAGSFAYRRIARAIGERLAQDDGALRAAAPAIEVERFVKLALDRAAAKNGTVPVRAPGRPDATAAVSGAARAVAAGARASRGGARQALAVGAVALVVAVGAWAAVGGGTERVAAPAITASVSPQALATTPSPAAFANAVVSWELTLRELDPSGCQLHLTAGGARVAALFERAPAGLHPGDRVRVRGRVSGRSRFGPIHLEGLAVERL